MDNSKPFPEEATLRHTTPEQDIQSVFNDLQNDSEISFETPEDDYCAGRAQKMARKLEQKGIYSKKVFLFDNMNVPNPFVSNEVMPFLFHIASIVPMKKADGSVVDMVIDPSLFNRPVTFDEWRKAISPSPQCTAVGPESPNHPPACTYKITERFTFVGGNARFKEQNWCPSDMARADDMMSEDIGQALVRRAMGAGAADASGRIRPSGRCVNNTGVLDTGDVVKCGPSSK